MKRIWVCAALFLVVLAMATPAPALDLKGVLQKGMANSDRVLAAKAAWDKARMERYASIPNFLPQLTANVQKLWLDINSTIPEMQAPELTPEQIQMLGPLLQMMDFSAFTEQPDHSDDLTLQAYQPLTQLPAIGLYDKMAADGAQLAKLGYEVTRDQIALYLGSAYYNVLLAQRKERAFVRALAMVDRLRQDGRNMMAQGLITNADLLKFEMRYSEVEIQLLQARNELAQAKSTLARLLDVPVDQTECVEPTITLDTLDALPAYLDRAEKDRRELRMTTLQESIAKANRAASYLNLIPSVGAVAAANWNDDGLDITADRTYSYGFVLSWNFWGLGRDVLKARAADYGKIQAQHEARAARTDLHLAVENAWRTATVAHQIVDSQKRTLAQAEENFRIEQSRYQVGKSTATELLTAQTQLTAAETGYFASLYGASLADAGLQTAIGRQPFPAYLEDQDHE
jgi:outer membrane protein TolC